MVVEKAIGGKPVFLSYLPAGSYVAEMALIDGGRRTATVRAEIKSEDIKLDGDAFRTLIARKPKMTITAATDTAPRQALTSFVESKTECFESVVDLSSSYAPFHAETGIRDTK